MARAHSMDAQDEKAISVAPKICWREDVHKIGCKIAPKMKQKATRHDFADEKEPSYAHEEEDRDDEGQCEGECPHINISKVMENDPPIENVKRAGEQRYAGE